jgi:multiple sugar transport system ATP-binding protein
VTADFVESLGADKYVHFTAEGAGARAQQLEELAAESGAGENEFVARVSTESKVTPGQTIELALDTTKLVIFNADTGANLSIPPAGAREEQAAPPPPPPPPAPTPPHAEEQTAPGAE